MIAFIPPLHFSNLERRALKRNAMHKTKIDDFSLLVFRSSLAFGRAVNRIHTKYGIFLDHFTNVDMTTKPALDTARNWSCCNQMQALVERIQKWKRAREKIFCVARDEAIIRVEGNYKFHSGSRINKWATSSEEILEHRFWIIGIWNNVQSPARIILNIFPAPRTSVHSSECFY